MLREASRTITTTRVTDCIVVSLLGHGKSFSLHTDDRLRRRASEIRQLGLR